MILHEQVTPAPTPFPGILHATLAGSADGLAHTSIWRQSMEPGASTPPHVHPCEEVVLCEAGEGEVHVAGEVHRFRVGQSLVLPANVPHQIFATGNAPLVTLAVIAQTPVTTTLPGGEPLPLPWRS